MAASSSSKKGRSPAQGLSLIHICCAKAARELLKAALADCHADFDQELAVAEEKKTPSARAKAQATVAEKYEEAGTRLEKAAALFAQAEQLAATGQWDPL